MSHERIPVPAVRIGAHTGLVVIGPEQARAVKLAAPPQSEAPPNSVAVTGETLELLETAFETEPIGAKSINGLSRITPVQRISRARPPQQRKRSYLQRGSVHVVSRAGELERIISHWVAVSRNGRCRTVFLVGEAGIGKPSLVVEFCRRAELNKANMLQVNCHKVFANTPLYRVSSLLCSCIGPAGEDNETVQIQNLSAFLDQIGINSSENLEAAASLLGRALTSKMDEIAQPPLLVRKRQFVLLIALTEQLTQRQSLLLWTDNAHWLDPSSAELLREIVDHPATPPIFILTLRFSPAGPAVRAPNNVVQLEPFAQEDCLELARAVPGGQALSDQLLAYVLDVADDIPLFIEQVVWPLIDQDANALTIDRTSRRVPSILAELASARLDRLRGRIEISEQHRLGVFRAFSTALWGWAACQEGGFEKGIPALQQAIETFDIADYRLSITGHLGKLTDILRRTVRLDKAQALRGRACQIISDRGGRSLEPEVRRVQGRIVSEIRQQGSRQREALHRSALECAHRLAFAVFDLPCLLSLRGSIWRFCSSCGRAFAHVSTSHLNVVHHARA